MKVFEVVESEINEESAQRKSFFENLLYFEPVESSAATDASSVQDGNSFDFNLLIVLAMQVIFVVCIFFFSLYHVANNAHSKDTYFGQSKAAFILVFIGNVSFLIALPLVNITVYLKPNGDEEWLGWVWVIVIWWQLVYIWLICPLLFAFYGTDDKDSCGRRLWDAFRLQLPLLISIIVFLVPTYFWCNRIRIPEHEAALIGVEPNTEVDGELFYEEYNNFMFHANAVTVIIGQTLMAMFGAMGVVFLPYNLMNDWIFRPKPLLKPDFAKRQKILLPKLLKMRKEQKRLEIDRM